MTESIKTIMIQVDEKDSRLLEELQKEIDYEFTSEKYLVQALTHKSYAHENNQDDNERFEFLGDAILQFVISDHLMITYPGLSEGMLSRFRAVLVSESGLSALAGKINLGRYLFIGEGKRQQAEDKRVPFCQTRWKH